MSRLLFEKLKFTFIWLTMNSNKIFFLNGHKLSITANLTISDILGYFNYKNHIFVVEYNKLICDQKNWPIYKITSNDKIEIITIVGGG